MDTHTLAAVEDSVKADAQNGEVIDAVPVEEETPAEPTHNGVQPGAELAPRSYGGGSTELIHAPTPAERISQARDIATALNDVIVAQGLRTKVGRTKQIRANGTEEWVDRFHVNVEGWQTLATLLGCAIIPRDPEPVLDPSTGRPILRHFTVNETRYPEGKGAGKPVIERSWEVEGHDWKVTVDIVKDGTLIASGTGLCSRTESKWKESDEYAVQGMAATRATSRAMKSAAAWIVALAGYSTTPAEEMPPQDPEPAGPTWAQEATKERKRLALDSLVYLLGADREESPEIALEGLKATAEALGCMPEGVAVALSRIARVAQELWGE